MSKVESLAIRSATQEDIQDLLALYAQPSLDDGQKLKLEEAAHLLDRIQTYPDYTVYVVQSGNLIVGTFALLIMDNLIHLGRPSGVIEAVAVHPEWQGRGIGKQMMKEAMMICRRRGCYKLTVSANLKRMAAHKFYESLGFEKHGYSLSVLLDGQF